MQIHIDNNSPKPLYSQVVDAILEAVRNGSLKEGDSLPSLSDLGAASGVSMETVKKAYNILKAKKILAGVQGRGFYVLNTNPDPSKKILVLFDKLSTMKLVIYRSMVSALQGPFDTVIYLHNQDLRTFENLLKSAGEYDYCLVTPHFSKNTSPEAVRKVLSKISNRKLIILDREVPGLRGNVASVVQDFSNDPYKGLKCGIEKIREYRRVVVICSSNGLYSREILGGIDRLFREENIGYSTYTSFREDLVEPGTLFIILGGQLDEDHLAVLKTARDKGYTLGKAIGVISYNDEPVNEFIAGGLTCLSSDFSAMGRHAAEIINSGECRQIHNEFSLVLRSTL